jgi:hypothetical protein
MRVKLRFHGSIRCVLRFNATLWDSSIDRLNQLGYVDKIRSEDVAFTTSATEPTLDITLTVREKSRN